MVGYADSGGKVGTARRPVSGRRDVARLLRLFLSRAADVELVPMPVSGESGVLLVQDAA